MEQKRYWPKWLCGLFGHKWEDIVHLDGTIDPDFQGCDRCNSLDPSIEFTTKMIEDVFIMEGYTVKGRPENRIPNENLIQPPVGPPSSSNSKKEDKEK